MKAWPSWSQAGGCWSDGRILNQHLLSTRMRFHIPLCTPLLQAKLVEDPSWTLEKELASRRGVRGGME